MKQSIVGLKSFQLAVRVVKLYRKGVINSKDRILWQQFVRCVTSIAANIEEANGAYSKSDFNAKISIAYKEAREARYWMNLFEQTGILQGDTTGSIGELIEEILKMLYSILRTSHFGKKN